MLSPHLDKILLTKALFFGIVRLISQFEIPLLDKVKSKGRRYSYSVFTVLIFTSGWSKPSLAVKVYRFVSLCFRI